MLQSDFCDYTDVYIVVKETITVADQVDGNYKKKLAFKNNAPFFLAFQKLKIQLLTIIAIYFKYRKSYSKTSVSLLNYYRDEPNSGAGPQNNNVNYYINDSKSFDYNTKITVILEAINKTKDVEVAAPLKFLENIT